MHYVDGFTEHDFSGRVIVMAFTLIAFASAALYGVLTASCTACDGPKMASKSRERLIFFLHTLRIESSVQVVMTMVMGILALCLHFSFRAAAESSESFDFNSLDPYTNCFIRRNHSSGLFKVFAYLLLAVAIACMLLSMAQLWYIIIISRNASELKRIRSAPEAVDMPPQPAWYLSSRTGTISPTSFPIEAVDPRTVYASVPPARTLSDESSDPRCGIV
jgi:hypothetical protein